ncbi:MAG: hypothetical protein M1827_005611 [Pycnora praestabilis]|nr:MAG: hypothetical protein M1827_005611 [Pycnora praestabilis]
MPTRSGTNYNKDKTTRSGTSYSSPLSRGPISSTNKSRRSPRAPVTQAPTEEKSVVPDQPPPTDDDAAARQAIDDAPALQEEPTSQALIPDPQPPACDETATQPNIQHQGPIHPCESSTHINTTPPHICTAHHSHLLTSRLPRLTVLISHTHMTLCPACASQHRTYNADDTMFVGCVCLDGIRDHWLCEACLGNEVQRVERRYFESMVGVGVVGEAGGEVGFCPCGGVSEEEGEGEGVGEVVVVCRGCQGVVVRDLRGKEERKGGGAGVMRDE